MEWSSGGKGVLVGEQALPTHLAEQGQRPRVYNIVVPEGPYWVLNRGDHSAGTGLAVASISRSTVRSSTAPPPPPSQRGQAPARSHLGQREMVHVRRAHLASASTSRRAPGRLRRALRRRHLSPCVCVTMPERIGLGERDIFTSQAHMSGLLNREMPTECGLNGEDKKKFGLVT